MSTDEPRDPFAEMLGRATVDPSADLVQRMRAETAALGAVDADMSPTSRRRLPRAGTFALVAASLLLVVGAVVFVSGRGADDPAAPVAVDGNYLPRVWPDGFDSGVTTGESAPQATGNYRQWLLSDRGTAMAQILRIEGSGSDAPSGTSSSPNGSAGSWTSFFDLPDASAAAYGRDVSGEGRHSAMLQELLTDGFELDDIVLPQGWRIIDDPDGVYTAAFTGRPRPGSPTSTANRIGSSSDGAQPQLMVMTIRTPQADGYFDALALLAGPGAAPTEVTPGRWGIIVDQLATEDRSVVWSPEPGVVVVVAGTEVADGDLLEVARSSRPVSATTWAAYYPPDLQELSDATCETLAENPSGLGSVTDLNGITRMGGSWTQVLGLDLFRLDDESLARVAESVAADDEGYERLVAPMDDDLRRAFDTMRTVASDPTLVEAERGDLDVTRAAYWVVQAGRIGCGFG